MPSARSLAEALTKVVGEVGKGLSKSVPEVADRGTAEAPTILNRALADEAERKAAGLPPRGVRHVEEGVVPFKGRPEDFERFRSVPAPDTEETLADIIDNGKVIIGNLARHEPGLPKDLSDKFGELRSFEKRIESNVDLDLRNNVFAPVKDDPSAFFRTRVLSDYMKAASEAAELANNPNVRDLPGGVTRKTAEQNLERIGNQLDPQIIAMHDNVRQRFDDLFDLQVKRGWIGEEARKEAYTPARKIIIGINGLRKARGEDPIASNVLSQLLRRSPGVKDDVNTDIVTLLRNYEIGVRKRIAQEDLLESILNDPTLNFTDRFEPGDKLPHGLKWYVPKPGTVGYIDKPHEQKMMDGVLDNLNTPHTVDKGRGFALPTRVAEALERFHSATPGAGESAAYDKGAAFARLYTVYNPPVTAVNMLSDTPLALMGMPGEKAQPIGFLRELPGAIDTAVKGVYSGGRKGGEKYERALREGVAGSTYAADIGGAPTSELLAHLHEPAAPFDPLNPKDYVETIKEHLRKARQTVELVPKIAAGEEALARTQDMKEYGRVGRNITLDFSKAPAVTRNATGKALAPFYAFFGSITPRILNMATQKGSKGRTLAAIAAVPIAIDMWNNHDPEYAKVEDGLFEWERNQLHIIEPGPDGKPAIDETGKPKVKRLQYWVPEQVANQFGLGNLPARARRIAQRKDTVGEFVGQTGSQFARSTVGQVMPLRVAAEIGYGRNIQSGKEETPGEAFTSIFPPAKMASEVAKAAKNRGITGPGGAAERLGEVVSGVTEASLSRKGPGVFNAAFKDAKSDQMEAQQAMRRALANGDNAEAEKQRKRMMEAIERMGRAGKSSMQSATSLEKFHQKRAMSKVRELYPEFKDIKNDDDLLEKVRQAEYPEKSLEQLRSEVIAKFGG